MKVKVSSHYDGRGWYDPKSGIKFSKNDGPIEIPEKVDYTNINRYITRSYLVVLDDSVEIEEKKEKEATNLTPGQILKEENYKSATPEVEEEEPVQVEEEKPEEIEEVVEEEPEEEQIVKENGKVECEFCGKEYSPRGIANHEKACKENPENM